MKHKFSVSLTLALIVAMLVTAVAFADPATDQSISINSGATDTNSLSVSVNVSVLHCPPGGDMQALDVAFRNSTSDPWTVVHAAGTPWPGPDEDGCIAGIAAPASFPWTLASGGSGMRTVYARFKHAGDEVFADDDIDFIANTVPTITVNDVTKEGNTTGGWTLAFADIGSASDAEDGTPSVSCTPAIGSVLPLGPNLVSCTATDSGGKTATDSGTVTVVDTTVPTIASHGDETAEATSAAGAIVSYIAPATSDIVDGAGTATCAPASGTQFVLGNTTVYCDAVDAAGNNAVQTSFVVHVVDTTPPVIAAHADVTAEATSALGALVTYTNPATSDAVDGAGTATCAPASGTQFVLGNTTVYCNAVDAAGNHAAQTSFVVHVVDTTPPTIAPHGDETAEATSAAGAIVSYTAPATSDIVDGAGTATCAPASGTQFALGNTTVYCDAVDVAGNHAVQTSFVVHVVDTTPPTLTVPADMIVLATSPAGAVVTFSATATDLVDPSPTVTCVPPSGSTFAPGKTIVSCTATDASGNTSEPKNFQIWVTYQLSGFYQPVDMDKLNTVKGGSTVPLKFEVFAGSTELTSTSVIKSFVQTKISCDGSAPVDDIEFTTTGGTSLRYDATAGQFVQNWQTPKLPTQCYRVTMTTQDGSSLSALFKLK